jgi:transcription initiation factor TFIID subunit 15
MKFTHAATLFLVLFPAVGSVAAQRRNKGNKGNNNNNNNNNSNNTTTPPANNNNNGGDNQDSLTLDSSVICTGCAQDGQDPPVAGQSPSLTSKNNYLNFCLGKTLTNGQQNVDGSCNAVPMGQIIPSSSMPSSKITFPVNGGEFPANKAFTFKMAVQNMNLGNFVNAQKNYFGAPQQVDNGIVKAHSHVTVQKIASLDSTDIPDPTVFAFFKGLNDNEKDGALTTDLTAGLPAGVYRFCSMNTAANHQPVNVAIAQHGSLDDCIYATAVDDNGNNGGNNNSTGGNNNSTGDNNNAGDNNGGGNNNDAGNNNNAGNTNNNTAVNNQGGKKQKGKTRGQGRNGRGRFSPQK